MLMKLLIPVLLATTVGAQTLSPGTPEEVGMSTERLARVDDVIAEAIADEEIPGAVVLVARQGRVVYRKAFGHRSVEPTEERMTVDTIFDLASLTKVIATATSVMILVEEGKLSLSDPVSDHWPDFEGRGKGAITVLNLLTHYSGLRPDLDLDELWQGYEAAIDRASKERLVARPGEQFIYSDINYVVLAEVVRQVSGKHLHEFTSEKIFKPLGMSRTGFMPPESLRSEIAPTEMREDEMIRGVVHDPTAFRMGGCAGHAGLFSTADDVAIFAQMILNQGVYDGVRILSPLAILKMTTPQTPKKGDDWRGIGFDIDSWLSTNRGDLFPMGSFGHTGFTGTSLWIDPYTETFVILFTNRLHPDGDGDVTPLRKRVTTIVAASMIEIPPLRGRLQRHD